MERAGTVRLILLTATVMVALLVIPLLAASQDYQVFKSEEYGFTIKYPASWVKIDNPKGNYYVVFQSPDKHDNFRSRIHVAAHKPVKDKIEVFLQEMRNGIKDLQRNTGSGASRKEKVKILDEGPFQCDVPGAHFFFIEAMEDKLKILMNIVIVFFKHEKTLLRVSCLASQKSMDKYHKVFNDVLVSVKFTPEAGPAAAPAKPTAVPPPAPGTTQEGAKRTAPAPPAPVQAPTQSPAQQVQPAQPSGAAQPAQQPRPGPRGPLRKPDKAPATGIVE